MRSMMLMLLTGCGGGLLGGDGLDGKWSGECAFDDYTMAIDVDLVVEGEAITGDAAASFTWQGYDFDDSGTVDGIVTDDGAALTLALEEDGLIEMSLDQADDSRLEGSCWGTGGTTGGGWLER